MLTGAASDCGPEHGGTSPNLVWSVIAVKPSRRGEVSRVSPRPDSLKKYIKMNVKTSFFDVMLEAKRF
jgi:hypothetical protein